MEDKLETQIENALKNRKEIENMLEQQQCKVMHLEAHKKTIAFALAGPRSFNDYPIAMRYRPAYEPVEVEDDYPFYILNIGYITNLFNKSSYNGIIYPWDYKVARRFTVHGQSKSKRREIIYTSSILYRSGEKYYLIRDDENNVWRGQDAFQQFQRAFCFPLPFADIEDWLGLGHPVVLDLIKLLIVEDKTKTGTGTLDSFLIKP